MSIDIVVPSMRPELVEQFLAHAVYFAMGVHRVEIIANGKAWTNKAIERVRDAIPKSWTLEISPHPNNLGVLGSLQEGFEHCNHSVITYFHDDVLLLGHGWDQHIGEWFKLRPQCGVIGFGGAPGIGDDDIYKAPYELRQLARRGFASNAVDAEAHGRRITQPMRSAVVDGYCMAFTRTCLDEIGGFPVRELPHFHNYDNWMCLAAIEEGREVWTLPVRCQHLGGQTSVGHKPYQSWVKKSQWKSDQECHRLGHEVLYERFRKLLPVRV